MAQTVPISLSCNINMFKLKKIIRFSVHFKKPETSSVLIVKNWVFPEREMELALLCCIVQRFTDA